MLESTLSRVFIGPDNGAFMPQEQGPICPDTGAPDAWHYCPTMEPTHLQSELKRRREAAGLSMRALSLLAGENDSLVKRIESGHTRNPRIDTLAKLADALGCRVEDLTGGDAEAPPQEPPPPSEQPSSAESVASKRWDAVKGRLTEGQREAVAELLEKMFPPKEGQSAQGRRARFRVGGSSFVAKSLSSGR